MPWDSPPSSSSSSFFVFCLFVFQFPLPSCPFHPLSRSVALHVGARGVVDEGKLEEGAEHKTLTNLKGDNGEGYNEGDNFLWQRVELRWKLEKKMRKSIRKVF
jgi:hypothetical protein